MGIHASCGQCTSSTDNTYDGEDFFHSLKSSHAQESSKHLDTYLACSADQMDLLKSLPAVCKLSVKLNTPLPASAASEQLFSIAGLVFNPQRARLDSCNFENQLLLKINSKFVDFKE